MQREIDCSRRSKHAFTIAFVDIDDFKSMNDHRGHAVGDQILRAVVNAAKSTLRSTDVVARLGGDEFAFLFPETNEADAQVAVTEDRGRRLGMKCEEMIGP